MDDKVIYVDDYYNRLYHSSYKYNNISFLYKIQNIMFHLQLWQIMQEFYNFSTSQ
jgi:hypothetical protein